VKTALAILLCCLAAAAHAARPTAFAAEVEVARDGARWTAEFRFRGRSPAWMFTRSELTRVGQRPWRPQS
jgi:hypothetical protein